MDFNLLTGRTESHLEKYQDHLLHKDVISHFTKLQKMAKKEIGADLRIISSFRSFERQKLIWNEKALGKRKIHDDFGNIINPNLISKHELLFKILRYSALPGASRHHWGTDLDIYDANKMAKENVELTPKEWEKGAPFAELGQWLSDKILQQESFGFFRPYEVDLGGVTAESWHLSFVPISEIFFEAYSLDIFEQNLNLSIFELKNDVKDHSHSIYERFIRTISLK